MGVNGAGKRKRGGEARTEQDKFAHKSSVLLQREAKKVRAFQVRKVVQQLKQTRSQLVTAEAALAALNGSDDATAIEKKRKAVQKMHGTIAKLENELAVFKALDLKAVVARALETTGLAQEQVRAKQQQQQQALAEQHHDDVSGSEYDDDDDDDNNEERLARRLADASGSDDDSDSENDGFDSDAYERSQSTGAADTATTGATAQYDDASDSANDSAIDASIATTAASDEPVQAPSSSTTSTTPLETLLIDRILAHKQMTPLLKAIETVIATNERAREKKRRRHEKNALKQRERNDGQLIGGRSSAAPTSLFLGSLSGRSSDVEAMEIDSSDHYGGQLAGAEDDIAEFLGETKKKKNRMGQTARRQKARAVEEAAKRRADRERGVFRSTAVVKATAVSKYGPSERPKKKRIEDTKKTDKRKRDYKTPEVRRTGSSATGSRGRERERGAPPAAAAHVASRQASDAAVASSHPSWLAKQALKEKAKASLSAFSGKKITFSDE